jgi:effector-binding domain-containing protein
MAYQVVVQTVSPRPIAAVRREVHIGDVWAAWQAPLDLVWAFLRTHPGIWTDGRNLFLYRHPAQRDAPMDVDFGVEVVGPFEGDGEVTFRQTPAGQVASTLHVGPYDRLIDAHNAIHAWAAANGRAIGGYSWEIYGHVTDDPATPEVEVVYLLA